MDNLDSLETLLLALGKRERDLELHLANLRAAGRIAAQAGRLEDAEAAWTVYDEIRSELSRLKDDISGVEVKLYGLRRRRARQ